MMLLTNAGKLLFVSVFIFGKLAVNIAYSFQTHGSSFLGLSTIQQHDRISSSTLLYSTTEDAADTVLTDEDNDNTNIINPAVAEKFKIVTCMSTSCCQKRKNLGLDSLATFGAMYSRSAAANNVVQVEEGPCLGSCKMGPCVAIEHDDFVGSVSLEGMTDNEFANRV